MEFQPKIEDRSFVACAADESYLTLVKYLHRAPTQSACVTDCYFTVNVMDLPFASPIAICR